MFRSAVLKLATSFRLAVEIGELLDWLNRVIEKDFLPTA